MSEVVQPDANPVPIPNVGRALERVRQQLQGHRLAGGQWVGELSSSALATATAISALAFYRDALPQRSTDREGALVDAGLNWLVRQQNTDGGWGDTEKNYSNISTSTLAVAAFHAAQQHGEFADAVDRGQTYVDAQGGVDGIRTRYGDDKTFAVPILANAAMAELIPWSEVAALPFEAACVPQKFYHVLQLPVVSYAIPALVAIGQVKFHFDPPRNPLLRWIRRRSIERSLRVLSRMQPASGGYLEAVPLTSFVCMALIKCGRAEHPVVTRGIEFLIDSFRNVLGRSPASATEQQENKTEKKQGTWPIDTNLATWVTTLSINALAAAPDYSFDDDSQSQSCLRWILDCQYKSIHPFTRALPGGFGWSDLSGAVPDADDTPGALLALKQFQERMTLTAQQRNEVQDAAMQGVIWLARLQNRDGGWPTFCRGWGRLPFDRSGSDLTAHVIRALWAWKSTAVPTRNVENAISKGFEYLARTQAPNGSWLPLWFGNQDQVDDINPFYGTAKVLQAYYVTGRFDTKAVLNGLEWMRRNQNVDGGWGGGPSVKWDGLGLGQSSIEETALCTEVLLRDGRAESRLSANRGLQWLTLAIEQDVVHRSSPIGFYFAKLWYFEKLYPLIFATSALGSAHRSAQRNRMSGRETSGETFDTVN